MKFAGFITCNANHYSKLRDHYLRLHQVIFSHHQINKSFASLTTIHTNHQSIINCVITEHTNGTAALQNNNVKRALQFTGSFVFTLEKNELIKQQRNLCHKLSISESSKNFNSEIIERLLVQNKADVFTSLGNLLKDNLPLFNILGVVEFGTHLQYKFTIFTFNVNIQFQLCRFSSNSSKRLKYRKLVRRH
jgi:hypothetical protein